MIKLTSELGRADEGEVMTSCCPLKPETRQRWLCHDSQHKTLQLQLILLDEGTGLRESLRSYGKT